MCSRKITRVQTIAATDKGMTHCLRKKTPMKTMIHSTNIESITPSGYPLHWRPGARLLVTKGEFSRSR